MKKAQVPSPKYSEAKWHTVQKTYKLARTDDPTSPFKLPMRFPGWYPDAIDNPSSNDTSGNDVVFPFLEEALQFSRGKGFAHFPIPHSEDENGQDVPFLEPDIPSDVADFYSWILGGGLLPKNSRESTLTSKLRDLADLARQYNAALYRLRRLHFYYNMCDDNGNLPAKCVLPPYNKFQKPLKYSPDGIDRNPPNCYDGTFAPLASEIEEHWQDAASALNAYIETAGIVDVVEVNGYIVSIRLVIPFAGRGQVGILEVGGSSSQISVKFGFSSPSDDGGMLVRGRNSKRPKAKLRRRKVKK